MNTAYDNVLDAIGIAGPVKELIMGRTWHPKERGTNPRYPFPPALLPAWHGDMMYWGVWRHWGIARHQTFVELYVELSEVKEIARTAEQFICHPVMEILSNVNSSRDIEQAAAFAEAVGITNFGDLQRASLIIGDDIRRFAVMWTTGLCGAAVREPAEYRVVVIGKSA